MHYGDRIRIVEALVATNGCLDTACRGHLLFTSGMESVYSYENAMTPFEVRFVREEEGEECVWGRRGGGGRGVEG